MNLAFGHCYAFLSDSAIWRGYIDIDIYQQVRYHSDYKQNYIQYMVN